MSTLAQKQFEHERAQCRRLREARDEGKAKLLNYLTRTFLNSFDARLAAARKAAKQLGPHRRPDERELEKTARELDPWRGTNEEVWVHYKPKASGGRRLIMNFGIENRSLQYLVLRLLEQLVQPHPRQFLLQGGIKPAIYQLGRVMADGPVCAYELDIKDCYQSFDETKLKGLIPLPEEVITRVIVSKYLNMKGGRTSLCHIYDDDPIGSADSDEETVKGLLAAGLADARRGIPQGSAVSPIVAERVLSVSMNAIPLLGNVFAYADNILLVAKTENNAVTMKEALWSALEAHPVGRLQPKSRFFAAGEPIEFLGHRLNVEHGHVRIRPTSKNEEKFEARVYSELAQLKQRITNRERADVVRDLRAYIKSWTSAFSLCDGAAELRKILNDQF